MTLVHQHAHFYERMLPYTEGRSMLMLGATTVHPKYDPPKDYFKLTDYKTLDPDGGDL